MLDPAKVAGKIVLCDRGVNARVNKSLAVKEAGGIGMVLVNVAATELAQRRLPLRPDRARAVTPRPRSRRTRHGAGATATINQVAHRLDVPAPITATLLVARPARRRRR